MRNKQLNKFIMDNFDPEPIYIKALSRARESFICSSRAHRILASTRTEKLLRESVLTSGELKQSLTHFWSLSISAQNEVAQAVALYDLLANATYASKGVATMTHVQANILGWLLGATHDVSTSGDIHFRQEVRDITKWAILKHRPYSYGIVSISDCAAAVSYSTGKLSADLWLKIMAMGDHSTFSSLCAAAPATLEYAYRTPGWHQYLTALSTTKAVSIQTYGGTVGFCGVRQIVNNNHAPGEYVPYRQAFFCNAERSLEVRLDKRVRVGSKTLSVHGVDFTYAQVTCGTAAYRHVTDTAMTVVKSQGVQGYLCFLGVPPGADRSGGAGSRVSVADVCIGPEFLAMKTRFENSATGKVFVAAELDEQQTPANVASEAELLSNKSQKKNATKATLANVWTGGPIDDAALGFIPIAQLPAAVRGLQVHNVTDSEEIPEKNHVVISLEIDQQTPTIDELKAILPVRGGVIELLSRARKGADEFSSALRRSDRTRAHVSRHSAQLLNSACSSPTSCKKLLAIYAWFILSGLLAPNGQRLMEHSVSSTPDYTIPITGPDLASLVHAVYARIHRVRPEVTVRRVIGLVNLVGVRNLRDGRAVLRPPDMYDKQFTKLLELSYVTHNQQVLFGHLIYPIISNMQTRVVRGGEVVQVLSVSKLPATIPTLPYSKRVNCGVNWSAELASSGVSVSVADYLHNRQHVYVLPVKPSTTKRDNYEGSWGGSARTDTVSYNCDNYGSLYSETGSYIEHGPQDFEH
jgi:hypothetical protein